MAAPRIFPVIWLIVESSSSTSVSRSKAQAVRDHLAKSQGGNGAIRGNGQTRRHEEAESHGGRFDGRREATRAAGSERKHERHPGSNRSCLRSDPAASRRLAARADPSNRASTCVFVAPLLRVWPFAA